MNISRSCLKRFEIAAIVIVILSLMTGPVLAKLSANTIDPKSEVRNGKRYEEPKYK